MAELSVAFGSGSVALTVALFVNWPADCGVTIMLMTARAPRDIAPRPQVTVVVPLHEPWVGVADLKVMPDGKLSVMLTFVAGEGPLPEELVEDSLRSQLLADALRSLPDRHRAVVVMRYGLNDGDPNTLEEIGRRLGLTRERVRQIEVESLRRLAALHEMAPVAPLK